MSSDRKISWGHKQRLIYIEQQLLWGRCFKARMLMDTFGVSRHQAGMDIKNYIELFPGNVKPYNPLVKHYEPSDSFMPELAGVDPDYPLNHGLVDAYDHPPVEICTSLRRELDDKVVLAVLKHIEKKTSFEAIYASASTPVGSKRILSPTKVIFASGRLHIRAYCHEKGEYRDFALSRFLTTPRPSRTDKEFPIDDYWDRTLTVKVIVNPNLSEDAQALIRREFSSVISEPLRIRASLLHYFLQENNLPADEASMKKSVEAPWSYPVVVELENDVKKYLFKA
ncbi:WYL domain-containing protein [Aestuariicella sp. G3-2]|uniref:WYL domain-containing protein n=1 Tax=Pseudomaricurvus albidus TaxID=2842452 RepID=UPI001C0E797C|nr:WYL domain-containing protein [Aestuariicella albida]MBU3070216.1 WYL domain-containing protein [Aestuariicella albida]